CRTSTLCCAWAGRAKAAAMARLMRGLFMNVSLGGMRDRESARQPPLRALAQVHVQRLGFGVVLAGVASELAADAALAVAAERQFGVAFEEGIDPDGARLYAACRREAGAVVLAPHRRRQAVQRAVGD